MPAKRPSRPKRPLRIPSSAAIPSPNALVTTVRATTSRGALERVVTRPGKNNARWNRCRRGNGFHLALQLGKDLLHRACEPFPDQGIEHPWKAGAHRPVDRVFREANG